MNSCFRLTHRFLLAAAVIASGCFAAQAHAQLTHYVAFDEGYIDGLDLGGSGGSDLGFGANTWATVEGVATTVAGNLTAPAGLAVSGNHASTSVLDFNRNFYSFDQNNDGANGVVGEDNLGAGEHWLSFVARADQGAFFAGLSFVKFFGPEILYIGKVSLTPADIDNDGDVDGADFRQIQRENPSLIPEWELNYGAQATTVWGIDPQDGTGQRATTADATVDTFLVARLTIGAGANDDSIDLFINPDINAGTPSTPDLTVPFNEDVLDNRAIDEIRLASQNGAFFADEIRIGGTFADVTPLEVEIGAAAVPEPSSVAILLCSAGAVWTTRRRPNLA